MRWAKGQIFGDAQYHLGASGLAPPPSALLGSVVVDLEHAAADMPPELQRGIADWWQVEPERVLLTLGTSHAMYLLAASRLEPGATCFVERPTYEMLRRLPALFGADVARFERRMEDGWKLPATLAARIAREKPALVLLSNPHNPTGTWLGHDDLAEVAAACEAAGSLLCIDEVYISYRPDPPRESGCRLGDHVAIASSFTKAFGLGTVRCGWLVAAPDVVARAIDYNDYISVLFPNPSAWVGMRALEQRQALFARADAIRRAGLDVVSTWIDGRRDVQWHRTEGGIIAFPRLVNVDDTVAFVEQLLRERGTVVVPGEFFEMPGCVRIGFGVDVGILREGLARLGAQLDSMYEAPRGSEH